MSNKGTIFSQSPNSPLTGSDDLYLSKKRKRNIILIGTSLALIVIVIIICILCFTNSSSNSSEKLSINEIRKDFIDTLITKLPSRSKTSYEDMKKKMFEIKSENNLGEAESAWLVFKWMTDNIQYDCYGLNHGGVVTSAEGTYKGGKSVCAGFSTLFKDLAQNLGLETEYLEGWEKSGVTPGSKPTSANHAWNTVMINNKKYLIDVTFGSGMCSGDSYIKGYMPYFFAPSPQEFIHSHFPKESRFQLLEKPIDFDTWLGYSNLYAYFYTEGFTHIEPDNSLYYTNGELVVKFFYPKNMTNLSVSPTLYYYDYEAGSKTAQDRTLIKKTNTEGCTEVKVTLEKKGKYDLYLNSQKTITIETEGGGSSTTMSFKYIGLLTMQNN